MTALFETFKTRAEAVSAEVHRYATKAEALGFIAEFLRAENVGETKAVWASDSFLDGGDVYELSQALPGLSFEARATSFSSSSS